VKGIARQDLIVWEKYPPGSISTDSTGNNGLILLKNIYINFKSNGSMAEKNSTANRELRISRLLNAPIELVWEAWTKPEHLRQWWGPNGFTNTISKMDVVENGFWELVMHGPDGTDYKNKSIFKEVIKYKKIVYEHITGPKFIATIAFEPVGNKTQMTWHMLFPTREEFIQTVETFKADEGLKQNVDKLEEYLAKNLSITK
jgi:uncharacterized protein YndB with AHSA1/START domain